MDNNEKEETLGEQVTQAGVVVASACIIGGIGTLGYQAYTYLRLGEWHGLSIINALRWAKLDWAYLPQEWLGLHRILDAIPLSMALILFGFASLFIVTNANIK